MKRVYFVDFDGTITKKDTTDAIVSSFARDGWQEIMRLWNEGKLSTEQSARLILPYLQVSSEEAARFLREIPIDDTFRDFLTYVKARDEQCYILSDGFDFNISTVLEKAGITLLPVYTNQLIIWENSYDIACPHASPCGHCGTCKKTLVKKLSKEADQAVYIGDGYSDHCGCQAADLIFAKGFLLRYCRAQKIPARPFRTFADIVKYLENLA